MTIDAVFLPSLLQPGQLAGRSAAVFDVLRATTTMTAALAAGVREIRIFGDLESAREAAAQCREPHVLCGEAHAVKPPGFDLGNSPGDFRAAEHAGRIVFMSTTNGTRAILAAGEAAEVYVAALVNAAAAAEALLRAGRDITLLCSGTEGFLSTEDVLGAGAVIDELLRRGRAELISDSAWMAHRLFLTRQNDLPATLAETRGGHNIRRAHLDPDLGFAARLNSFTQVGVARGRPPVIRLLHGVEPEPPPIH